jgi:hypothetical protein
MTPDLASRRRALLILYRRYLKAERAFLLAQDEAWAWFPRQHGRAIELIGNPGSRLRALYDQRQRAIVQLAAAHRKLQDARSRRRTRLHIEVLALP